MNKIPFSKLTFGPEEEKAVIDCMRSGWVVLGPKTKEFEEAFAKYVGSKYAVFVDSGTSALFLAIRAAGYKDHITIPSLTFTSGAEVAHHAGLEIKFGDINKDSLCMEPIQTINGKMSIPTNCMATNFAGVEAKAYGKVIDSCHRIEKNDIVPDDYSLWCYSFYATKNISTVQGGMIALNSKEIYNWLLLARDHGTTKGTAQRYKGKNPLYDVEFPGWRVKPDDLRAVIGLEQLKKLPEITKRRNEIVARYNKNLGYSRTGNHLYPIFVEEREGFIEEMFEQGIQCSVHFPMLHTLKAYKDSDAYLPVSDWVGPRICSIPLFPQMTDEEVDFVSEAVLKSKKLIV